MSPNLPKYKDHAKTKTETNTKTEKYKFCMISKNRQKSELTRAFRVEHRSPAIFSGGGHEFVSEIGLFRQLAGNDPFLDNLLVMILF